MNVDFAKTQKRAVTVSLATLVLALSVGTFAQTLPTTASVSPRGKSSAKSESGPVRRYHEEWTALSLETNTLIAQTPVLGAKDDPPESTFIRERYQMQWRPDDPLDVFVVRPKGVTKPPVILYMYSFPQDTDRFNNNAWCATVTSEGYAAVGFVSALTGHRMEHRAVKKWFVSELQEAMGASTHDVQMILNYLEGRGDLDMDRVGMFGQGSGGSIAILASAVDPRIKAIDLLTPWGDWPAWLAKSTIVPEDERASYLTPEFLTSVADVDPAKWFSKVKAKSVRIQNVRQDAQMPDDAEEQMEAAGPEFLEINQFGDPAALYPYVTGGRLVDWIKARVATNSQVVAAEAKSERVRYYPPKGKRVSVLPLPSPADQVTSGAQP